MKLLQGPLLALVGLCVVSVHSQYGSPKVSNLGTVGKKSLYVILDAKEDKPLTWASALTECQKQGFAIAAIESKAENDLVTSFIVNRLTQRPEVVHGWLGGTDYFSEGNWYWLGATNKPMTYKNWDGTPTDSTYYNCMYTGPVGDNTQTKWKANYCDIPYAFPICQSN